MKTFSKILILVIPIAGVLVFGTLNTSVEASGNEDSEYNPFTDGDFPKNYKYLFPPPVPVLSNPDRDIDNERVAYGAVDETEELEQPIAYSHKLHAGELKIECQYCHSYARRSPHAGIPSTQICMNCHGEAAPTGQPRVAPKDRPELYKLLAYNYGGEQIVTKYGADMDEAQKTVVSSIEKQPIPWVKVHDLPDFVYFTHKRHVKAGLECQECHGEVQDDMTVARRVSELTMGWCLSCHESHPSIVENYCTETEIAENKTCEQAELRRTEIKDCYTCHK
jgi:hypothetical protein